MSGQEQTIAAHPARYWHRLDDGRVQCDLCPRNCRMREGQRGLCYVRGNEGGELVLHTWGHSSGFCIDPIEKKPLLHFYPGTSVLSFGTAGCNLACKFCQNWDISKSREMDKLGEQATPEMLAAACVQLECRSIAYTYNDPVIFLEYAVDVAAACREAGIYSVAVSAGYVAAEPRRELFAAMDAANIDLKAFSEKFYRNLCGGQLGNVLETLEYLVHETDIWVEVTTLVIPGENDSNAELDAMTDWFYQHLGPDVPLHFTAFHPDWKMRDTPHTPVETLCNARLIAYRNGLRHVYIGNVHDPQRTSSWCCVCNALLIERGVANPHWGLDEQGACRSCGTPLPGLFDARRGTWEGRQVVRFRQ